MSVALTTVHQVVAIPLRKYVAVRAVDKILTDAGFLTTYHYVVPKVSGGSVCRRRGVMCACVLT